MEFGVCLLSVIPVRVEPSDNAELVTQVLFGDLYTVTETKDNWKKIRIVYDNYEGWVDHKQITIIEENEFNRLNKQVPAFCLDLVNVVHHKETDIYIPIMIGSTMRLDDEYTFSVNNDTYVFDGESSIYSPKVSINSLIENALVYLNAPYLWGGKSPFGIDCSGFTQIVYKISGVKLLRDSSQQATQGETITFINEAKPGDLLFFDNSEGQIIHVGIYLGNSKIIHASGKVRVEAVDHNGIYSDELKKYSHNLRLIKRIL